MRGPTHALGGATTALLFIIPGIPHTTPLLMLAGIGAFAALFPDLDNSESTIENIKIGGIEPFAAPAFIIEKIFKHRGFLHSLLAVAILAFVLLGFFPMLPNDIVIAALLGYTSHLFLDGLTPIGIPWLYPYENQFALLPKFLCIRTGSFMESLFFIGLLVLFTIFLAEAGYIILPNI